ncbi:MAG TPA: nuclear transport factor 2 family protein [Pyrinomonadaceae bacterium]|jgi:hypothetical protein|nr:nuclear transport factor 2 family protein [Pyrinomonadaceae bacterium]
MKRMLICAALLACVAACSSPTPAPNNSTGAAANANTAATPAPAASPTTGATSADDAIIAQEKQVWDAIKNKDFDGFASMLADDQVYISNDGFHDKADTIKGVKALALTDVAFSDWKVTNLDKEAALVTYTLSTKGTANGKPLPSVPVRASTAWMKRNGKWVALYHQDTDVAPAPAPASSPQAKQGAAPAPSPPQATGTSVDPKFKEQQVWDALKRRDFDAFAAFLADDFIELEPDAVTDKAGSVKGVQQADFSRAVLSDFKLLNFDKDFTNDVSLVTYLVKGTPQFWGESGQRHTTIWTHREGKWFAAFHQGTPQKKPNAK